MYKLFEKITYKFVLCFYFIGSLFIFYFYRYQINPDAISYISIAQKYLSGNFYDAINGYWSPMISWFLVPFTAFDRTMPIIGFKIISILCGLLILHQIRYIFFKNSVDAKKSNVCLLFFVPFILYCIAIVSSPDLLSVYILLLYVSFFIKIREETLTKGYGLYCGLLGALGYLTKAYIFYFFVIHYLVANIYLIISRRNETKKILLNAFLGFLLFITISSSWMYVLSQKYGEFTVSTTGAYNMYLVGPESKGHLMFINGLMPPPNETATSVWEDISFEEFFKWSPFKTKSDFKFWINLIVKNILSPKTLILVLPYFFFIVFLRKRVVKEVNKTNNLIQLLLFISIYTSGYVLITVEGRYFWINYILGFIIMFICLDSVKLKRATIITIAWLFMFVLALMPMYQIVKNLNTGLVNRNNSIEIGSQVILKNKNIASNAFWHELLFISYYNEARYYGIINSDKNNDKIGRDLKDAGVDYFFSYYKLDHHYKSLKEMLCQECSYNEDDNLYLYEVVDN